MVRQEENIFALGDILGDLFQILPAPKPGRPFARNMRLSRKRGGGEDLRDANIP